MGTTIMRVGIICTVLQLFLTIATALQPEICIAFVESESASYDFVLRCNFTNAPNVTNITWSYPAASHIDESNRFNVITTNEDDDQSHFTELSVYNFNDSIDEGEYYCIGEEHGGDILFGGQFLINACEDITMDPAFNEIENLLDENEELNVEEADTILTLGNDLYDTYDSSEFKQEVVKVFVKVVQQISNLNFTEQNETIDILDQYLELSSETLSIDTIEDNDFSDVIHSMEKTFTNALDVLDEDTPPVVIKSPKAEVYLAVFKKESEDDDVIDLSTIGVSDDEEKEQNTLKMDISSIPDDSMNTSDVKKTKIEVASSILSIRLTSDGQVVSIPVNFTLVHDTVNMTVLKSNEKQASFTCSFIDHTKDHLYWSAFGCVTSTAKNSLQSNCNCNHTTSFAVLMKVTNDDVTPPPHETALSWIMYIGCGVSIFALSIALATFSYVGVTDRIKIHICLCATLLVAELLMLCGINMTEPPVLCTVIAVILHFSFLSVFAWMLVEGIHMYVMIIRVFGSENINFNYYFVIGWVFPMIVVGASVGAKLDGYGTKNSCWLDVESGLIWAFVAPSIFVIVVNFLILIRVVTIIKRAASISDDEMLKVKSTIKGIVVLLPILGVTWVFGLFAIGSATLPFQYIFSILNSLQGLFIFIFYCLMNSEVRSSFERKRKQHQLNNRDLNSTFDESRTGKTTKQSKVTAVSLTQLQSTDDKKDVISITVAKNKVDKRKCFF
ncbi:adhesion G protein-coupled receptor L3-like [Anneissia japonica]|uniref:adhesion G protein-coupled receptor L3-like n=1 Tax=Anneissia japonica TaxID=1529436 RepID=UPI00142569BF|nr:adhesion G protein-coupled receptor L3-like [Anneissia japonica]